MNVLVINCGSSSLKYQLINSDTEAVLQKVSARESELTEDWFTKKPAEKKRSQKLRCLHIKRQSRWFWTLLQMKRQAQLRA